MGMSAPVDWFYRDSCYVGAALVLEGMELLGRQPLPVLVGVDPAGIE